MLQELNRWFPMNLIVYSGAYSLAMFSACIFTNSRVVSAGALSQARDRKQVFRVKLSLWIMLLAADLAGGANTPPPLQLVSMLGVP